MALWKGQASVILCFGRRIYRKDELMIDYYVSEIRSCLDHKNYFAALSLTLMLPDICGMAEFPNKQVAERYITWYDDNVEPSFSGDRTSENHPRLSGEVVYNLRNQFFHQGEINVVTSKIREEDNRIDRFVLILGDGTKIDSMSFTMNIKDVWFRFIMVDVTSLCESICNAAAQYFTNNKEKFKTTVSAIPQDALFAEPGQSPLDQVAVNGDPLRDILNEKLLLDGQTIQITDNVTDTLYRALIDGLRDNPSDDDIVQ